LIHKKIRGSLVRYPWRRGTGESRPHDQQSVVRIRPRKARTGTQPQPRDPNPTAQTIPRLDLLVALGFQIDGWDLNHRKGTANPNLSRPSREVRFASPLLPPAPQRSTIAAASPIRGRDCNTQFVICKS
jgi:hypothetical protein